MLRYKLETNCTNFTIGSKSIILESKKGPGKQSILGNTSVAIFFHSSIFFLSPNCRPRTNSWFYVCMLLLVWHSLDVFWMVRKIVSNFKFFVNIHPKPQNISRKQEQLSPNKGNMKKRKFGEWLLEDRTQYPITKTFFLYNIDCQLKSYLEK